MTGLTVESADTSLAELTPEAVIEALADVRDPEIPVVSVVELGIVQSVVIEGDHVTVAITPTFSGCPALDTMRAEIVERVRALGATEVDVPIVLSPPWTSDRIAPAALRRMAAIGIAPPPSTRFEADIALSLHEAEPVPCAYCGSASTVLESAFGPTICRSIYFCRGCQQSFELFKAL